MKNEDVGLIQRILSGDESAFTALVDKHREWIHSLAWREIGDFHAAQEITQDTFIQAFKSLPTLRITIVFWLVVCHSEAAMHRMVTKEASPQCSR